MFEMCLLKIIEYEKNYENMKIWNDNSIEVLKIVIGKKRLI